MRYRGYLFIKWFVKFSCETVQSRAFVCWEFFDYCFNFVRCYQSVQAFCFFFIQFLEEYIFLEIRPFHLGSQISWRTVLPSNFLQSFVISVVSVIIPLLSFRIMFIWVLSLFFLMSPLKGLSILFIFSKNHLQDLLILRIVLLVSMSFNSALILVISFLLLSLGCLCCCSSSSCRCSVRLFI